MEKMSNNPARLYKLDCGRMEAGAPADLVLFDENRQWTVKGFESKSSNSPFLGATLTGKVMYTVCKGRIVYGDGESNAGTESLMRFSWMWTERFWILACLRSRA